MNNDIGILFVAYYILLAMAICVCVAYVVVKLFNNNFMVVYLFLGMSEFGYKNLYTVKTNDGLEEAENVAWGNATFDGCSDIELIGRNIVKKGDTNGTVATYDSLG